jgi:hypothetical protein
VIDVDQREREWFLRLRKSSDEYPNEKDLQDDAVEKITRSGMVKRNPVIIFSVAAATLPRAHPLLPRLRQTFLRCYVVVYRKQKLQMHCFPFAKHRLAEAGLGAHTLLPT